MLAFFHSRLGSIYYGWWMVAIGSAVRIVGGGLHYYGSSIFFLPVSQELGLSRAATSLVFSLARAQGALEGPLAGYIIDRYGPRPVILSAMIFTGLGYLALSEVHSFATLLLVYMGLISLSYQAGVMDATMAIPANWFVRHRSIAMAWMSASIGLGGLLVTPILAYTVHSLGWRYGALGAGIAFLVIGIPVTLPLVRAPETIGLSPNRDPEMSENKFGAPASQRKELASSLAQALRAWQFWVLMGATTLRVFCLSAVTMHFIPIMTWKGLSEAYAAILLSAAAFMALPAHMIVGWLADRYNRSRVMASAMLVSLTAVIILIHASAEWQLWVFVVLFAATEAVFPPTWSAVVDFFGRKNFAKIRGAMSFVYAWGGVLGPVAAGLLYDQTQDYSALLWLLAAVLTITAAAYATLAKPQASGVAAHG